MIGLQRDFGDIATRLSSNCDAKEVIVQETRSTPELVAGQPEEQAGQELP